LGVLIYVIARGDQMFNRDLEEAAAREAANRQYIQEVAAPTSSADELAKLADLRDRGILTSEEFASQKAALLSSGPS
jgi:hypothetical protein